MELSEAEMKSKSSVDGAVMIRCPRLSCGYSIVWHKFNLVLPIFKGGYPCPKCKTLIPIASIQGARYNEIFHFNGRKDVIPQSGKAYYKGD